MPLAFLRPSIHRPHAASKRSRVIACNVRVLAREARMRGLAVDLEAEVLAFQDCIREVVEMRRLEP